MLQGRPKTAQFFALPLNPQGEISLNKNTAFSIVNPTIIVQLLPRGQQTAQFGNTSNNSQTFSMAQTLTVTLGPLIPAHSFLPCDTILTNLIERDLLCK